MSSTAYTDYSKYQVAEDYAQDVLALSKEYLKNDGTKYTIIEMLNGGVPVTTEMAKKLKATYKDSTYSSGWTAEQWHKVCGLSMATIIRAAQGKATVYYAKHPQVLIDHHSDRYERAAVEKAARDKDAAIASLYTSNAQYDTDTLLNTFGIRLNDGVLHALKNKYGTKRTAWTLQELTDAGVQINERHMDKAYTVLYPQQSSGVAPRGAYTDAEIAAAGVKLEQTPLQKLSDYAALSQILQSNIPKNVFTEQAVAQATALADVNTTAEQLGLPSLAEYIKLYTDNANTQNNATRQALELATAQLYDKLRKQDLEWLATQTETDSKKSSADTGAQAAALLETLANAKGENVETIVKAFTDNLTTAEDMQKAVNEAYAAGQSQYDTGRLNIAQHTNDANAIAAQNLATIGALYEAAQQSENSFNKSKAEHATAIQDINNREQTKLASDIIALLTAQQDNEIQRRTVDSIVRNIIHSTNDGASNYSDEQAAEIYSILKDQGFYNSDEDQLTADAVKLLKNATQGVDYSYLQKDATAQAVLDNKVINSVLFDPYEQARRTKTQTLDEYANSIGIQIDPRYYADLYDTAAVNAFKTYDTQRKYAENAMLRNLIAGDQSTNAPLRKRTMGAMSNNDRAVSAATQLSNMQNNATNNADAIWRAYTAEKTAPAKEAAARSKAATDALAYYQNLMTNYDAGGTGGVLQQLNNANKNSADNLATYGSLAQQGMAGLAALNDANTSITNANADARATYQSNINTLNKNRSIQNLREQAFAKQASAGAQLGKYNISIN